MSLLRDLPSAERTLDDLMLACIEARRIHGSARRHIDSGNILMMATIPFTRSREIAEVIARHHTAAIWGGAEPSIRALP